MRIAEPWTSAAAVAYYRRRMGLATMPWQLRWQPVCGSTELGLTDWLRERPLLASQPRALLAGRQTQARGQRGRVWQAAKGGVWMSAALPWPDAQPSAGLLGLAVAVALVERLEQRGLPARIKWPNDLMLGERKLAGLLPRLVHRGRHVRLARVGLGLNVCNRVPREGIALVERLPVGQCKPLAWTAEVLCALDRAMEIVARADWVRSEAERRLWAEQVRDPSTGEFWAVNGLGRDGSLLVSQGAKNTAWTRW